MGTTNRDFSNQKLKRKFLPLEFKVSQWEAVLPIYQLLESRPIDSVSALESWLQDWNELDTVINEEAGWRYIRMTCNTGDQDLLNSYNDFIENIAPNCESWSNKFKIRLVDSPYLASLDQDKYFIFIREIKKDIEIFREENIAIQARIMAKQQEYAAIMGALSVTIDGKELTLQQASVYLKSKDREVRKNTYVLLQDAKQKVGAQLDELFSSLLEMRHQVALNAGFANFREYKFRAMGRFDYTAEDCQQFHEVIRNTIVPLVDQFNKERKEKLGLDALKPYDQEVELPGDGELKPFNDSDDLIKKTIACFSAIRKDYGQVITVMNQLGHLDLASRKNKAPGGYNYPLGESGVPFIFMNAVGLHRDMVTMVHEGGHALHSFLTNPLQLDFFKQCPSEVAELASMSMELLSMEHWESYFDDKDLLNQAKKEQLEKIIRILPWIAQVDHFQHWLYVNPKHSLAERKSKWLALAKMYGSVVINYDELEAYRGIGWQSQLHIFEVPFYYIEYGFAQLGALSVWRNYKSNPTMALDNYEKALSLGYTKSIPEIYKAANIKFDFSNNYVTELVEFLQSEIKRS